MTRNNEEFKAVSLIGMRFYDDEINGGFEFHGRIIGVTPKGDLICELWDGDIRVFRYSKVFDWELSLVEPAEDDEDEDFLYPVTAESEAKNDQPQALEVGVDLDDLLDGGL